MRINQFIARATGMSRRSVDEAITGGRISINGATARLGATISDSDIVTLDDEIIKKRVPAKTILLNKPVGYVCSRDGQGSKTIYDLLPPELHQLKPVGRLDKDSSGLILLTNDGQLAQQLTHPSFQKQKIYEVELNKNLSTADQESIKTGIKLGDGLSRLAIEGNNKNWVVNMSEGRNRQIRRTFASLGYSVIELHRTVFGNFLIGNLNLGSWQYVSTD